MLEPPDAGRLRLRLGMLIKGAVHGERHRLDAGFVVGFGTGATAANDAAAMAAATALDQLASPSTSLCIRPP